MTPLAPVVNRTACQAAGVSDPSGAAATRRRPIPKYRSLHTGSGKMKRDPVAT